jgi:hypothetical protein
MNTTRTAPVAPVAARLAAFASALLLTITMLAGIDALATQDSAASQVARQTAAAPRA